MKRNFLICMLLLINSCLFAQENQLNLNSKITNVTVFMSGAQVQRQAEPIDLPVGTSLVVFSGLSSSINAESIQVKGDGNFTVLSVTPQQNFLTEKVNTVQINLYKTKIEELNDKLTALRNESEVYRLEEEMLLKNQNVMGPNVNYDLVKLKQALDFQKQRLMEAKNKQVLLANQQNKLQTELNKYNQQINEMSGRVSTKTNDVVVKVSTKVATKAKFSITYLINGAGWYPSYDIRAKDVSSPIELVYKANVSQSSGEDWKNIKLMLSSGNPSTNNAKPELQSYNLGFTSAGYYNYGPANTTIRLVKGRVTSASDNAGLPGVAVRIKNSSVATTTDGNGSFTLQIPQGSTQLVFSSIGFMTQEIPISSSQFNVRMQEASNSLNEVMVVGYGTSSKSSLSGSISAVRGVSTTASVPVQVSTIEKQTNIVFDIKNPYTILSDGKQFSVDIGNYDFKADYEYYAAPKLSEDAFLTAKINGFNEVNLISGEANIFFEGTYLGKTLIDVQNSSDTLTISLGVDKNVVIKREKQKDFNERQFIGSSQKDSRSFVIDVKNRKNQPINLTIEDQLPLSTSSDITVERQEISKAKLDELTGILTWQLLVQPNEQKKLTLKYQVKYPKNKPINLE